MTARTRTGGSWLLVLPRASVAQILYTLPTQNARDAALMVARRLRKDFGLDLSRYEWAWRFVRRLEDGAAWVRVTAIPKQDLEALFGQEGIPEQVQGALVEDEYVLGLRSSSEDAVRREESVRLYGGEGRVLGLFLLEGQCVLSAEISLAEFERQGRDPEALLAPALEEAGVEDPSSLKDQLLAGELRCTPEMAPVGGGMGARFKADLLPLSARSTTLVQTIELPSGGRLVQTSRPDRDPLARTLHGLASEELLPPGRRALARGRRVTRALARVGGGIALLMFVTSTLVRWRSGVLREERVSLDRTRALLQDDVRETEAARQLVERVAEASRITTDFLHGWDAVAEHLDGDIRLSSLSIEGDGRVSALGTTGNREAVLFAARSLESDSTRHLDGVSLGDWTRRENGESFRMAFRLRHEVPEKW